MPWRGAHGLVELGFRLGGQARAGEGYPAQPGRGLILPADGPLVVV
jgi:hypothetical protein